MDPQILRHAKSGAYFVLKPAHAAKIGDEVLVQGQWLVVQKIEHLNRHPFRLINLHFAEFREPLRIPSEGWELRIKITHNVESTPDS